MNDGRVRALVVDDSPTARALLTAILNDGGVEVVGDAADGAHAVAQVHALHPSVVVMDIHMPDVDGFAATQRIMAEVPTPIVIVTGGYDPRDVAVSLQATRLGALTVLPKPAGPASPTFEAEASRLLTLVRAMADVKVIGRRGGVSNQSPPGPSLVARGHRARVVGVGASTGGPAALYRFLEALPEDLAAPVLVVQHIPDGFVDGLVRWLQAATPLAVHVARHGEALRPGVVHVGPPGRHLEVDPDERVRLTDGSPSGGFRPSVSVLFTSLAARYGPECVAVVLTGMGNDGLEGARRLRAAGAVVYAQDEESSVVFGMPKAVAEAGLAEAVGDAEDLARLVVGLTCAPERGEGR